MNKTQHTHEHLDRFASWTMLVGSSGVWLHNTFQFLHSLVG